jgi:hypothetical protein
VVSGSIIAVAPPATMDDAAVAAVIDTDLVIRDAKGARAALHERLQQSVTAPRGAVDAPTRAIRAD